MRRLQLTPDERTKREEALDGDVYNLMARIYGSMFSCA